MWETVKGFKSEAPFSVNDGIVFDHRPRCLVDLGIFLIYPTFDNIVIANAFAIE